MKIDLDKVSIKKPTFKKKTQILDNDELSNVLIVHLYDKILELCGFRYNRITHPLVTTAVLLAKEYDLDSVIETIKDQDGNLYEVYTYLISAESISGDIDLSSPNYNQSLSYGIWHDDSRIITDHLSEDMQPKEILNRLLSLYDFIKENGSGIVDHDIFTEESTFVLTELV